MADSASYALAVIPVPLLADDPDVTLDQLALDTVYDAFNYDLSLDYKRPAAIPWLERPRRGPLSTCAKLVL